VLIDNVLLVDAGPLPGSRDARRCSARAAGRRAIPDRNISDLKAQVAACTRGAERASPRRGEYGREVVDAYMGHVMANAEEAVRRLIGTLEDGEFTTDGQWRAWSACASGRPRERSATFDFTGTSAQQPNNFNAPYSICRAATLYVFRTLMDDAIPMNDGCLRPIELIVPEGSMLNPRYPAAVVAGNVETSQVITDACSPPAGRLAPSQGTMNNFTFGNERYQYYETIAGGAGAGRIRRRERGADAHDQQPPDRSRDPGDALPVLLERFAIRRGSGGEGAHKRRRRRGAGHPLPRADARQHPLQPPAGAAARARGGGDAASRPQPDRPRNWVERAPPPADAPGDMCAPPAGGLWLLPGRRCAAGRPFVIETPRGGGFGESTMNELLAPARHPARRRGLRAAAEPDAGGDTVAALATGLLAGLDLVEVISTFGKAFNDNRIIAIVWIVLPVIGLLERFGLQQRAAAVIRGLRNATTGGCCSSTSLPPDHRRDRPPFDRRPPADGAAAGRADGAGRGREAAWRARRGDAER
jgi:5-oxoprolinase (ATP-hydrolysing)